jgi:hypothetical protein
MPMTPQPNPDDSDRFDRVDECRYAYLDDVGLPGYSAVMVVTRDGEERLVLCCRDDLNRPGNPYWPADWRKAAPHELTGRLPRPYAPTCGRRATSSGKPCRIVVPLWGDACPRHACIDTERTQPA